MEHHATSTYNLKLTTHFYYSLRKDTFSEILNLCIYTHFIIKSLITLFDSSICIIFVMQHCFIHHN